MTGPAAVRHSGRWHKDAAKYLLDGEQAIVHTRRHWAVLIGPAVKAVLLLVVGGWLLLLDPANRLPTTAGFLVVVGALGYLGLRGAEWWMRHFLVTRRRVLLTSGVVVRTVTLLPLRRITDLTWKETLLGQVLGYGTFRFESAGQQQALSEITYLPRADLLYRDVSELLFGSDSGGAVSGDDEGNADWSPPPPPRPAGAAPWSGRRDTEPIPRLPPNHR